VMNTKTHACFSQRRGKLLKRPGDTNRNSDTGQGAFDGQGIEEIRRTAVADGDFAVGVLTQIIREQPPEVAIAANDQHLPVHSTLIVASDRIQVSSPAILKPTKR